MALEYIPQTDTDITLEELSLVIQSSRDNFDTFTKGTSPGFYALEAAHVIGGLKRAAKAVEPPSVPEVLRRLDEDTIWDAQMIVSRAMATRTSPTAGDRRVADQILKVKTI